jgi:hypothetical protein
VTAVPNTPNALTWVNRRASHFLVLSANMAQMSKKQTPRKRRRNVGKRAVPPSVQQEVQAGYSSWDEYQNGILRVGHCVNVAVVSMISRSSLYTSGIVALRRPSQACSELD